MVVVVRSSLSKLVCLILLGHQMFFVETTVAGGYNGKMALLRMLLYNNDIDINTVPNGPVTMHLLVMPTPPVDNSGAYNLALGEKIAANLPLTCGSNTSFFTSYHNG